MSNFGTLYIKPPIYTVDGTVKERTILDISNQIEAGFEAVGGILGNIHGVGMETIPYSRFINSISTTVGKMSQVSPCEPYGEEIIGYVQTFSNTLSSKSFLLDLVYNSALVPGSNSSFTISSGTQLVWQRRTDIRSLSQPGDYSIDGRVLTFFTVPTGSFTVTYNGVYPELPGVHDGYSPNVIPDPVMIEDLVLPRPILTLSQSGRIIVDASAVSLINRHGRAFGAPLEVRLSPTLQQFVSASGAIECPPEYISAWLKDGSEYRRLEVAGIYITSNSSFELDTDEIIDLDTDTIVMSVSNVSLTEMIQSLQKQVSTHSHDVDGLSPPVSHGSLLGLLPGSDNPYLTYGGSKILDNDHPQYMHREGYRAEDPGTYNNALLGDLLISSSNMASFESVAVDSNKILFGSPTDGPSLRYSSSTTGLELNSQNSGLSIRYDRSSSLGGLGRSYGLSLNGKHEISDLEVATGQNSTADVLGFSSSSGYHIFANPDMSTVLDIATDGQVVVARGAELHFLKSNNITVTNGGFIRIGGLEFSDTHSGISGSGAPTGSVKIVAAQDGSGSGHDQNQELIIDVPTLLSSFSGSYLLGDSSEILFGGSGTRFSASGDTAEFHSSKPLVIRSTGIDTGIAIEDPAGLQFTNLYSASQDGGASRSTDHDTYMETADGSMYFLKSTKVDHAIDGGLVRWNDTTHPGNIENLTKWPRSSIFAGTSGFRSILVDASNTSDRRGISFTSPGSDSSSGGYGNIYVTGDAGGENLCPIGWMVLESQNGVVLTDIRQDAIDCQTMRYSDLTSGSVQAFGSIVAEQDISSGGSARIVGAITAREGTISENLQIGGSLSTKRNLTVGGITTLSEELAVTSDIRATGDVVSGQSVRTNGLVVLGASEFSESSVFKSTVTIAKSLAVGERLDIQRDLSVGGTAFISHLSVDTMKTDEISVSGVADLTTARVSGSLTVDGSASVSGMISSDGGINTTGTIFARSISVDRDIQAVGNVYAKSGIFENGFTVDAGTMTVDDLSVGGNASISGSLSTSGSLSVAEGAVIRGDADMKTSARVGGVLTVGLNLDVARHINARDIEIANSGKFGSLEVLGSASMNSLSISTSFDINGAIESQNTVTAARGFITGADTISSFGDMIVGGEIRMTNPSKSLSVAGNLILGEDADVGGRMKVEGSLSSGPITATGNITGSGGLSIDGAMILKGAATIGGAATVAGTLGVVGTITTSSIVHPSGSYITAKVTKAQISDRTYYA